MRAELHPALEHHLLNSLGWSGLRPLQERAVAPIVSGEHVLLLAPTAGGKTEAAVLPVLSRMLDEGWTGLSVLYVCPLRALLNNLHPRLEHLAGLVGRRVGLWHGDVGEGARRAIRDDPPDVLLTTPESLEAMLISTRTEHDRLFRDVRVAVVDEVHAFAGDDRGWHLLAVLARVTRIAGRQIQRIGMSATVGDPEALADWLTRTCGGVRRVLAPSAGEIASGTDVTLDHVGSLHNAAVVLSRLHGGEKRLVFVDSRARAEELATSLRERDVTTFLSHGSLGRAERRRAEEAFVEGRDCVIVATSTLELGLDIGDLDRVVQIDAPPSVAGFLQRLGRSGRRAGSRRNALLLATNDDALVQSVALLRLWERGAVEPVTPPPVPAHLLVQQLLALVLQNGGVGDRTWWDWLGSPHALGDDVAGLAGAVLAHLRDEHVLVDDGGLLTMGAAGEAQFGRAHFRDLTASFLVGPELTVMHGRSEIGRVPDLVLLDAGPPRPPLLLGGRSWVVRSVDWRRRVVQVEASGDRGRARWFGDPRALPLRFCEELRAVLRGADPGGVTLSRRALARLEQVRDEAWFVPSQGSVILRLGPGRAQWWTFAGRRANHWLATGVAGEGLAASARDNSVVTLEGDVSAHEILRRLTDVGPGTPDLPPGVLERGISRLKFAEALPIDVARDIVRRRMRDDAAVSAVAAGPVTEADARA